MSDVNPEDRQPNSGANQTEGHFAFQAEVARLLHLMVHAVYSEKDVFLRELISNSADACDRLRYLANLKPELLGKDADLRITLMPDKPARTLSIADNGIGMSREELIDNLGTVARSGTRAFIEQLANEGGKSGVIGQFGVGFYSAFIVADKVDVWSRAAGEDQAHIWSSDGVSGFTVAPAPGTEAGQERGTIVKLHLKQDSLDDLEDGTLERIVRTYSDHIPFPIELITEKDGKEERRQLNSASALWTRPKSGISEEQYRQFYHDIAGPFDEAALVIHYKAEGLHEYSVLLFVPGRKTFDLYDPSRKGRVKLYVRRVFITDDAELLPAYLRFVRGIVDSEDMPLNISREMLQNNPLVAAIRKALTNRVLLEIAKLADSDAAKFEAVWEAFGAVLKEGLYEDPERRDELYAIARFRSTKGDGWRSLKDYLGDFRPNQTAIYYLVGDSPEQVKASPMLEGFRARGIEVLLLSDPVDHFWVTSALGFEGKPFKSVSQGEADLSLMPLLDGTAEPEHPAAEQAKLLADLKAALGDQVSEVRASARLVDSPACLVAPAGGPDRGLNKLLARQAGTAALQPILEVNLGHELVRALAVSAESGESGSFADLAHLLLDEARILEGEPPADPVAFARRLNQSLVRGLKAS